MTAPAAQRPAPDADERIRAVREAKEEQISRAEGWRRRGPLLPALIFTIVVTQVPFVFTLYYSTQSWNLVSPGSRRFVGLQNYVDVFQDSQFWQVALKHAEDLDRAVARKDSRKGPSPSEAIESLLARQPHLMRKGGHP